MATTRPFIEIWKQFAIDPTKLRDPEWLNPTRKLQPVDTVQDQITGLSKTVSQVSDAVAEVSDAVPVAPLQIVSVSAVESPVKVQGRTMSQVAVSFTRDVTDTNYAGVRIWLKNYQGDPNPRLVMQGTTSPIYVVCETTNETITVIAQAVSVDGTPADFSLSPSTTVLLDGVTSAPPAPSMNQMLVATPTGYQFAFNQLGAQAADIITAYKVYRSLTNSVGAATLYDTIPHDPKNSGGSVVVNIPAQYGEVYYFWITAVNAAGIESTTTAAQTGTVAGHAANAQLVLNSPVTISTSLPNPSALTDWVAGNTVTLPITGLEFDVYSRGPQSAHPDGDTICEVLLFAGVNGSNQPNGYLCRFDNRAGQPRASFLLMSNGSDGPLLGTQIIANNPTGGLPVGWYRVRVEYFKNGLMNIYVNGVWCFTAQDTTYTPTGATYLGGEWAGFAPVVVAPGSGLLTSLDNGYSMRSSPLIGQGSIATIPGDAFSYSATASSIAWSWGSFSIFAPDGTVINIASGSQAAFTGLSASTTYHFYMYVTLATGAVTVVKSSVSSGTAKETIQNLAQIANADGRVCPRPDATAATPASGSTGGSGGGGGTGCFTAPVEVKTPNGLVPLGSLPRDRSFEIVNETGTHLANLIVHENYAGPMLRLDGDKLVTPNHAMRADEFEWVRADEKYPNAECVWFEGTVYNLHVVTECEADRHFVLFNGDAAHNMKMA